MNARASRSWTSWLAALLPPATRWTVFFGALASHRRAGDTIKETRPALVALAIAAVYRAVAALHP